ncbi:Ribosomal RNA small subunit methyltransferase I [Brevundimonas diminuta]|jgi:16S rRNA (cytidine1402-2'-O)-methyltransferase|uniref:16S rRNA (cytidine(1402)-2'-O)-methyltransferase n=2 Tax=Brevundimonas diminuta TaxID=293 RepID=UPI000B4E6EC7|nr:16S rRNA (cytidine(1402)-2'-O)-methyltransferase [Brevundimonas diminuta]MBI2250003.1 16S rRNA (cytidine(1402)-2'-O)-methyltransferase [Brevundimonas diminuta]OWR22825.1 16S rRNA (cytidine(1402)-2'-O)-methyltransferase [Brevundimonas diminuta]WQE45132.1 16S rRNA (cytidine(1402)-2'-O)-methyltransferase [Brevundimonas diminuta]SPU45131.1 Ribosomal RNA small subunit methyltransferase I [Brevundimonas diminuta]SUW17664.1 Ribosomal RNA small subunit methyltransferase I [Brevundimonas diminuta]
MSDASLFPPTAPPARPVSPGLYLVATPIGNLRDMTLRALDVLAAADLVLAEDTRVTAKLLTAYGLKVRLERCDDHASNRAAEIAVERLKAGEVVALVSDAGTPLVSDPGYVVARAAVAEGLPVHPVPGPSSLLAALCIAGLPADRVLFAGFLPPKSAARRTALEELRPGRQTLVFFESGPRLRDSLADMAEVLGARPAAVARELTKLYEECVRGDLAELAVDPRLDAPKGEIVVVVGPGEAEVASAADADAALAEALTRLPPGEAAAEVSKALNLPRKPLYKRALELKGR